MVDARKNLRTCVVTLFGEKADFIENVIGYYRRHQSYGSFVKALGKLSKEYKTFEKNIEGVKRDLSKSSLKLANLIAKAITRIYEDWYDVYKT